MSNENEEYLTPGEILEEYPFLKADYNWTIQSPGALLSLGLLDGKYLKGKHMTLIARSSLKKLFALYLQKNKERSDHLKGMQPD